MFENTELINHAVLTLLCRKPNGDIDFVPTKYQASIDRLIEIGRTRLTCSYYGLKNYGVIGKNSLMRAPDVFVKSETSASDGSSRTVMTRGSMDKFEGFEYSTASSGQVIDRKEITSQRLGNDAKYPEQRLCRLFPTGLGNDKFIP